MTDRPSKAAGLAALMVLLLLLLGAPVLLASLTAGVLPAALPTLADIGAVLLRPDDGSLVVTLILVAGWVLWAVLAVLTLIEALAVIRRTNAPRVPGLGGVQGLLRKLIVTVALAFVIVPTSAYAAPAAVQDAPAAASFQAPATTESPAPSALEEHPSPARENTPAPTGPVHTVGPGESLWGIAEQRLGDGRAWQQIEDLNREILGSNPGFLRPGWVLRLPAEATQPEPVPDSVTVAPGDSLSKIAGEHLGDQDRYEEIAELNAIANPDLIHPGDQLALPQDPSSPQTAIPTTQAPVPPEESQSGSRSVETLPGPAPAQAPSAGEVLQAPAETPEVPAQDLEISADENQSTEASEGPATSQQPAGAGSALDLAQDPAVDLQVSDEVAAEVDRAARAALDQPPTAGSALEVSDENETGFDVRTTFSFGALAASGVLMALAARRALQRRRRQPGQRLPAPEPEVAATEAQLHAVADDDGVVIIDKMMRHIAQGLSDAGEVLPALKAVRLTPAQLEVYLTEPATLPEPWIANTAWTVWAITRSDALAIDAAVLESTPAPYPALVTVGQDLQGGHILIDLETAGTVGYLGEEQTVRAALGAMTLELATTRWADDLQVTVAGTLALLADNLDNGRLRYVPTVQAVLEELENRAANDRQELSGQGASSVKDARLSGTAPGAWTPEIIVIATSTTPAQQQRMTDLVSQLPHVALAFVTSGHRLGQWAITISGELATLEPIGLDLHPQLLPFEQLDDVQELFALTSENEPLETIDEEAAATPEPTFSTLAANPPASTTDPALPPDSDVTEWVTAIQPSTDPADDDVTLAQAAHAELPTAEKDHGGTDETVDVVEPQISPLTLRLLGPITLEGAQGPLESKKRGSLTELAAYLALHPGATEEQIADAIWPNRTSDNSNTRHTAMSKLRRWLGTTPQGTAYFPHRSAGGYRLDPSARTDISVWNDLINHTPEKASTTNLHNALLLIRGRPFTGRGRSRYGWADTIELRLIDEISEAAYELARRRIEEGHWRSAERALATGIQVDPLNERLLRLRIRIAHASNDTDRLAQARARLETIVRNLDCELEPETQELLDEIDDLTRLAAIR